MIEKVAIYVIWGDRLPVPGGTRVIEMKTSGSHDAFYVQHFLIERLDLE